MLQTRRLILKEMTEQDLPGLRRMLLDPVVMKAYAHRFDECDVRAWLARQQRRYRCGLDLWGMFRRTDGVMIGQAGLTQQLCETETVLEVGYLLQRDAWRKGFAYEAATACVQHAFESLHAPRVCAIVRDDNFASQSVARHLGMQVEKAFLARYFAGDLRHLLFAVSAENWVYTRGYRPSDLAQVLAIFHDAVHALATAYTPLQRRAWAPESVDEAAWNQSLLAHETRIALCQGRMAGFADLDVQSGYLDRLYVHPDFVHRGVAKKLVYELELHARLHGVQRLEVHASRTARPAFEHWGYVPVRAQQVQRRGQVLENFVMYKDL